MEHVVAGLLANNGPVGDVKVHDRALAEVGNPPPVILTMPEPSTGRVPNPGEAAVGDLTSVGPLTFVNMLVKACAGCVLGVTVKV
jgi:hypothetical protein